MAISLEDMVSRYVVTAAQRGATPYEPFLESLHTYCKANKAELLVCPINGAKKDEQIHPTIQQETIVTKYNFNKSISLKDFEIQAQMMNPLTGLNRLVKYNQSVVIASPKQQLKVLANSNSDFPKIITSTGCLTEPNYNVENRAGLIAEMDHIYGAVIVEVINNKLFNIRHIRSKDGSFYDLGTHYTPDKVKKHCRVEGLVLGDLHTGSTDTKALQASFEQILALNPKALVLHDIFDAYSISHHHEGKPLYKSLNYGKKDLREELDACGAQLQGIASRMKGGKVYVVKSNHDEHLTRYLEEGRFMEDERNLNLGLDLAKAYFNGKDPLQEGIKLAHGKIPSNVKFLTRDDDYKIKGVQCASHGDLGANGSRGSAYQLESTTGPCIVGHSHTPQILRDVYQVGTLTKLKLDYNRGPSSWLHTNGVINPDGTIQLLNIIDGRWR